MSQFSSWFAPVRSLLCQTAHAKSGQSRLAGVRRRLEVEELEERTLLSYFPLTTYGIHVFEDQLPGLSSTDPLVQFLATHVDGTQKQTLNQINLYRAINPNFTLLHYQLGTGNSPYSYIINGQWGSDWNYVTQQESWFAH